MVAYPEEAIARSGAPVLITGETGTGKEVTARRLHQLSRRKGPFIAINCGAFSEELIDAELFGHEAGAFTGAVRGRPGWFETAQGGTLLLDEIGDLPLNSQCKLLRVLQERTVTRLGSRKSIALDVRVIAATNVDLEEAVRCGQFRADLYYRLNVAPIELPPLRASRADIVPLAQSFLKRHPDESGRGSPQLSSGAVAVLESHDWPGNIRELENVIQLAVVHCRDNVIEAADIRLIRTPCPATALPVREPDNTATRSLEAAVDSLFETKTPDILRTVEQLVTQTAFQRCGGNQVRAAQLLGVTRNTMRTLLRRSQL